MKYIKYFKEGNKDDYYVEIEIDSDGDSLDPYEIDISDYAVDYIKGLFDNIDESPSFAYFSMECPIKMEYRYLFPVGSGGIGDLKYMEVYRRKKGYSFLSNNTSYQKQKSGPAGDFLFFVAELEDEYFVVYIGLDDSYYKCDQLDGVKELLVDKGIIEG